MRLIRLIMCCIAAPTVLAACQSPPGGGDSVLQAMGKGALAGIQEGLTGQEQQNPYVSGDEAPQQAAQQHDVSSEKDLAALTSRYGRKHAGLIVQGHIDVGMNQEEVTLAWGEPSGKLPKGRTQEVWDYGSDKVVFTKGKVSAVRH